VRAAGVATAKVHLIRNVFVPTAAALTRDEARIRLDMPDVPSIGWIGRLSTEKGPDIALEAFARLERPNTRLVMIGGGPDESSLRRHAEVLGVADRVLWRGVIPDAGRLLPAFDAFLLSSRTEGTPVALLEAMAAGVPIVATRVGGVPDTVDASSALLVDSGASAQMATALGEIFDAPDLARRRAQRARSRLDEHFNVQGWLSRYESIYRQVMKPQLVHAAQ
jgi:glycosyltransferase involved in cell wall biosynthesis